jgi:hypothetical protein
MNPGPGHPPLPRPSGCGPGGRGFESPRSPSRHAFGVGVGVGSVGDLAQLLEEVDRGLLLEVHAEACDSGVADPVKLAAWMVRFGCEDQDFF